MTSPQFKKHLVTASYVSPEMAALNQRAKGAGVAILCEMGLDPGIGECSPSNPASLPK